MDAWKQYLFESHSEATLREWAKRLRLFRFVRAAGGHANDGDSLEVMYEYGNVEQLHQFFDFLGIPLTTFAERPPQPEKGVPYPGDVYEKFPSLIPGTQWIQQPEHCSIADQKVFIWCGSTRINISLGANYSVTAAHVQAAEIIETVLANAPLKVIDPPVDDEHCICPKYYPTYFRGTGRSSGRAKKQAPQ